MEITVLDAATLGEDIKLDVIKKLGNTKFYDKTNPSDIKDRIKNSEVVVLNKLKLGEKELSQAKSLKLICVTATGYDNIDIEYCHLHGIAVCNVVAYSTNSVAQLTAAMALSLSCHLTQYDKYSKSGEYTKSAIQNMLSPTYYELSGKTWGIIGCGAIGSAVKKIAEALGCSVIYTSRSHGGCSLQELMKQSDIISLHVPLTNETKCMIGKSELELCEKKPILINVSRGAVCDEAALVEALKNGLISGLGIDVYSTEPFDENSPYNLLKNNDNTILTPHMAWGAYEARVRCVEEVAENIKAFQNGEKRNRVC